MELFSDGFITIIFGDGPLGFRVGETQFGHPTISGFTEKEDSSYFPVYVMAYNWSSSYSIWVVFQLEVVFCLSMVSMLVI